MKRGIPWVFAAVAESYGLTMNIIPGETPCFACVFGNPGRRTSGQRQQKAVLPAITHIVASFQVSQAVKLLLGDGSYSRGLLCIDAWEPVLEKIEVQGSQGSCRICGAYAATPINEKGLTRVLGVKPLGGKTRPQPQLQVASAPS